MPSPYIKMNLGKATISDVDNYVLHNFNPIFGKMFEFSATLPMDYFLTISVLDHLYDELIGETKVDLENRFFSRHRATCGIAESFSL